MPQNPSRHSSHVRLHEDSILRPRDAAAFLGVGRATLYRWAKQMPDFPKRVRIGQAAVGWRLGDLSAWVRARAEQGALRNAPAEPEQG